MSDFDQVVDRACTAAGADFAFVLTRKGRLVTRRAPRDMPEAGRTRITRAARSRDGSDDVVHLEMPREDLVPFGGAAPVDVFVGIAAQQAVLCLVMSTWAEKRHVMVAMDAALLALEKLINKGGRGGARGGDRRAGPASSRSGALHPSRRPPPPKRADLPPPPVPRTSADLALRSAAPATASSRPPPPPPRAVGISSRPPPPLPSSGVAEPARRKGAMTGLIGLSGGSAKPARSLVKPAVIQEAPRRPAPSTSMPDIQIGEASLGRESLEAITREMAGGRLSTPDIALGEAPIGRATLAAIEAEAPRPPRPTSAPDAVRVELVSISRESAANIARAEGELASPSPRVSQPLVVPQRITQPWVEPAEDAKRAVDAARKARNAPPQLTLDVADADTDVFEAARLEAEQARKRI